MVALSDSVQSLLSVQRQWSAAIERGDPDDAQAARFAADFEQAKGHLLACAVETLADVAAILTACVSVDLDPADVSALLSSALQVVTRLLTLA